MSTYPRLEARVSALERRQTILDARIEEVSEDMVTDITHLSDDLKASFKQLAAYQIQTEQQIDTRFNQVDQRFSQVDERFDQMDEHFNQVDERFGQVDTRLDKLEVLLTQILERLPKNL